MSGDIEVNSGPKRNSYRSPSFSVYHWKLNSLIRHSFLKVLLLTLYLSVNKFDNVCLSKTCLNSQFPNDAHDNLHVPCYSVARVDHTSNTKHGGVCLLQKFITFEAA